MAGYYDLHLVQGARYRRTLRWTKAGVTQNVTDYQWRSQIRAMEDIASTLILDLTEFFSINDDSHGFDLLIPATATSALSMEEGIDAYWDFFIWPGDDRDAAFPFLQGLTTYENSTTDMRT